MSGSDIAIVIIIIVTTAVFIGVLELIKGGNKDGVYDFEGDYGQAVNKPAYKDVKPIGESTLIGVSANKKNVFVSNDAKHVFICGTTGSGKTIALSNFLKSGMNYQYPMLIIDGKGYTGKGSLLEITKELCQDRKLYIINLNDPKASDKYNPFKNTNTDVIKDMLINMTNWSEEHYKYNTERYIQRLCKLLAMQGLTVSLESLTHYLTTDNFLKLSKELSDKELINKAEHIENIELAKTSGKIAEGAAAIMIPQGISPPPPDE